MGRRPFIIQEGSLDSPSYSILNLGPGPNNSDGGESSDKPIGGAT